MLCDFKARPCSWDTSVSCKEALGSFLDDESYVEGKAQLTASSYHQTCERGHWTQAAQPIPSDCIRVNEPGRHHEEWTIYLAEHGQYCNPQSCEQDNGCCLGVFYVPSCSLPSPCTSPALTLCDGHTDLLAISQCNVIFSTFLDTLSL